jgi:2-methylcitrate dehydratase
MVTAARKFAEYGLGLTFADLPDQVIKQAKRVILDYIGCAIGGYSSPTNRIVLKSISEFGGQAESTVIGSGLRTSCLNAALANGSMARFLECHDLYLVFEPVASGSHPSEIIPSALAVGERQHSTGKQVLEAIVSGYELSARYVDASAVHEALGHKGWNSDLRAVFIVPVVAGRLLEMDAEQVENAIGIAASYNMVLGILDDSLEEGTMARNLRFPFTAYDSIMASFLAKNGLTGPKRVIEGHSGYVEAVAHGDFDYKKFTDFKDFKIMETRFRPFVGDGTTFGHLDATLQIVKEHDIKPEDVARVRLWAAARSVEHTGQPDKRYPKNKETADHSSYYLTAVAIMDRKLGPEQFTIEKYEDPKILELNSKVSLEVDPSLDQLPAAGISEITTKQGISYRKRIDHPKGTLPNPMTDQDLEEKFRSLASKYMSEAQMTEIINVVSNMDKLKDIGELMKLLEFRL